MATASTTVRAIGPPMSLSRKSGKEDGDANGATEGGAGVERGATRRIGALGSAPKHRASAGLAGAHHRVVRGGGTQHRGRQPAWNIPADRRPLALAVPAKRS